MSICLLDSTILCEFLEVPNRNQRKAVVRQGMETRILANEVLLLPMVTILETGNHVGQHGDGRQRRAVAERFVDLVQDAIAGKTPFTPTPFFQAEELSDWLREFPDWAMRSDSRGKGIGLGDLMIVKEFVRQCALHRRRRVYIWSFDEHLSAYDRRP